MGLTADDIRFGTTIRLGAMPAGCDMHPSLALALVIDAIRRHAAQGITVLRLPPVAGAWPSIGGAWQHIAALCHESARLIGQLGVRLTIHAEMHVVAAARDAAIHAAGMASLARAAEVLETRLMDDRNAARAYARVLAASPEDSGVLERASRVFARMGGLAAQIEVDKAFADRDRWTKMAALNTARSGFFSSDRTIRNYMRDIWSIPSAL